MSREFLTALQSLLSQPENQRSLEQSSSQHDGGGTVQKPAALKEKKEMYRKTNTSLVLKAPQPLLYAFIHSHWQVLPSENTHQSEWAKPKTHFAPDTHTHTQPF